ncbi:MAG: hypothetical protein ACRD21_22905 [Vicinamibacteria bacterium]
MGRTMHPGNGELDDLSEGEAERLKKRFDAWREAMERLRPEARGDEPLFPSELENPT